MSTLSVEVVLPCLDEAAALPGVLDRIPAGYGVIVVDNGSSDGTGDVARARGVTVVDEPRRGFGAAVQAGIAAARADLVAICDADASLDPGDLPALVALIESGRADLVLGRRRPTSRGAWPLHARLANRALAALVRARSGVRMHDLGPMRVARRGAVLSLDLQDRRSGYPLEMVLAGAAAGWRIVEIDVPYSPRVGRSKVTGTIRGTVHAVQDMSRMLRIHHEGLSKRRSAKNS